MWLPVPKQPPPTQLFSFRAAAEGNKGVGTTSKKISVGGWVANLPDVVRGPDELFGWDPWAWVPGGGGGGREEALEKSHF